MKGSGYIRIPRGLEVSDRGTLARECPACGDLFYRYNQCVSPDHPADGYVRHWRTEHRDLR